MDRQTKETKELGDTQKCATGKWPDQQTGTHLVICGKNMAVVPYRYFVDSLDAMEWALTNHLLNQV